MSYTLLDEAKLRALMSSPQVVAEFPFLAPPAKPAGSGCCGQPKEARTDYNTLKRIIAGLPPERRKRLFALAGVVRARLIYHDGQNTKNEYLD